MSEWDAGSREFEELVDAVLRERSRVEPRAELAGRMLAGIEAAAREREVRVRWWRRPSPGWLGLGSLAGVAAVIAVAVFGGGAFRDGRRVPASQAKESAPVRLSAPVAWTKSAEVQSMQAAHVPLHARGLRAAGPEAVIGSVATASVAVGTSEAMPRLETFPSRTSAESATRLSSRLAVFTAPQIVLVDEQELEVAELRIQPISTKTLPSDKELQ